MSLISRKWRAEPARGHRRVELYGRRFPCIGLLIVLAACHDAPRDNPVDPTLTPALEAVQFEAALFDSRTATATLAWNRSTDGFERYEIQRQTDEADDISIVHLTSAIDDTMFVDTGLDGNTEYSYRVILRSTAGQELESAPVSGQFHRRLREWQVPAQMTGGLAIADDIGGENRIYVASTGPNQIFQFTSRGELLRAFSTDPTAGEEIALFLAADRLGVYAQVNGESGTYLNAFDLDGTRRFRWAPRQADELVTGVAFSPDGELWVTGTMVEAATGGLIARTTRIYRLDALTGNAVDTLTVEPTIINGVALGEGIGVAVIPVGSHTGFSVFDMFTGEVLHGVARRGSRNGQFNFPVAAVFGRDNRLFIVDGANSRVQVFRDSDYLTKWGESGEGPDAFRFHGNYPGVTTGTVASGIAVDSAGSIYVADTFNNRIQVFEP